MIWLIVFLACTCAHIAVEIKKVYVVARHKPGPENQKTHSFSIIICARNEEKNLPVLISEILKQDHPDFEIILVLDRCSDSSLDVAYSISDPRFSFLEIRDVPKGVNPKKFGLTKGIEKARNEWILLTDGDCLPETEAWISEFNSCIGVNTEVIIGLSPYSTDTDHTLNVFIRYETFQTALSYCASTLEGKPYMGVGRNLAYRKSVFITNNGFNSILGITGGDDDLLIQQISNQANTALVISPQSLTFSSPVRLWKNYFHQKTRHLAVGRFYKKEFSAMLTYRMTVHFVLWLSFLILVAINRDWPIVFSVFGLYLVIKGLIYRQIFKKLSMTFNLVLLPVVDFMYGFALPLIGIRAFFVKNYVWKKN